MPNMCFFIDSVIRLRKRFHVFWDTLQLLVSIIMKCSTVLNHNSKHSHIHLCAPLKNVIFASYTIFFFCHTTNQKIVLSKNILMIKKIFRNSQLTRYKHWIIYYMYKNKQQPRKTIIFEIKVSAIRFVRFVLTYGILPFEGEVIKTLLKHLLSG